MGIVSWVPQGRAGNFYFQAAVVFAYAKQHGLEFSVPKFTNSDFHSPLYLHHLQHPNYNPNVPRLVVNEQHFHYAPLPFDESWQHHNVLLNGYFQSYKYFNEYREEMLNVFALPWHHIPDTCSIHARFGDYLTIPGKHILVDEQYLRSAMKIVTEKTGITKFKVFSDDIRYFQHTLGHIHQFEYSTNGDITADLLEASCCHSNIGSSSTFSFWIAYLNKNPDKVVIQQSQWFQNGWTDSHGVVNTNDILLPEWIKI